MEQPSLDTTFSPIERSSGDRSSFVLTPEVLGGAEIIPVRPEDRDTHGNLLVVPGGPVSNLNEQDWKIVRTEHFKEWFGDWQVGAVGCFKNRG